jgi:putative Mn2+ efflux pump MntP
MLAGTAVGLSMDACAVAITHGLAATHMSWAKAVRMGAVFGVCQGAMPCIGYALGIAARPYIEAYDHWVALIVLGGIGGKMLWDARRTTDTRARAWPNFSMLLILGLATSIDALAAGFALPALEIPVWIAAGVIALVTFCLVTLSAHFGSRLGRSAGRVADAFGGCLMIALGVWIVTTHIRDAVPLTGG